MQGTKFLAINPMQNGRMAVLRFELYDKYADMFIHPGIFNKNKKKRIQVTNVTIR
jgi:hypothetical protein